MNRWTVRNMPDQSGRTALVTGANSGLGYETVLALARKGAHVVMTARSVEKGEAARAEVLRQVPNAQLDVMTLDLSRLASVREFADAYNSRYDRLDQLYNNAGVMAIPRRETEDGFEMQLGVNHLGHFALTGLLLDTLLRTPGSRVISVSSGASYIGRIHFDDLHLTKNYTRYGAYSQSKLANVMFAFELDRKFKAAGADSKSLVAHPGYANTNLQSTSTTESGSSLERVLYGIFNNVMAQSAEMGALPQLYAGTAPNLRGGEFIGPNFLGMRGYPTEVRASQPAYDDAARDRFWNVSADLTGVQYSALQPAAQTV